MTATLPITAPRAVRPGLPPLPPRIARLPLDPRGYPVPWFVAWIDGAPDFRVIDPRKLVAAVTERRCWICGGILGVHYVFTVGPMCAVNRISSEPPAHLGCAEFAARACPFLTRPTAARREANLPEQAIDPAGVPIRRNPGVALLWSTKRYQVLRDGGGMLFRMGAPTEVWWYAEGRRATREEVQASLASGLPALEEAARTDADPKRALRELYRAVAAIAPLLPRAAEGRV